MKMDMRYQKAVTKMYAKLAYWSLRLSQWALHKAQQGVMKEMYNTILKGK
jgi:hypothetical protein